MLFSSDIARRLYPGFWLPDRKPLRYEVDRGHILCPDYFVLFDGASSLEHTLLSKDYDKALLEVQSSPTVRVDGRRGRFSSYSGTDAHRVLNANLPSGWPLVGQADPFTVAALFRVTTQSSAQANNILVLGELKHFYFYEIGGDLRNWNSTTGEVSLTGIISANTVHFGFLIWDGNNLYINVDGVAETSAPASSLTNYPTENLYFATRSLNETAPDRHLAGDLFAVYAYNRPLSLSEIRNLVLDPYLFLEPATNYFWVPAQAAGGTVYTVTVTDGIYIPDEDDLNREMLMREHVLLGSQRVSDLSRLLTDTPLLLSDSSVEELVRTSLAILVTDGVLFDDVMDKGLEKTVRDALLTRDETLRDREKTVLDLLLLGDSESVQVVGVGVELVLTDGVVFLEETARSIEATREDALLLRSDVLRELDKMARDFLLLLDTADGQREVARRVVSALMLGEVVYRERSLGIADTVLLESLIQKVLEKMETDGHIFTDSVATSIIVGGVIKALVFAALRSVDFLGMVVQAEEDLLGIDTGSTDPIGIRFSFIKSYEE